MNTQELNILQELRKNARRSLTEIGNVTEVPLSSVFKKVAKLERRFIQKYVSLVDFNQLGWNIKVSLVLKAKERELLKEFLLEHPNVNSLYRISQSFDFLVETVFANMLEFEDFLEKMNDLVSDKKIFHIIEDIRKEDFALSENELVQ